MTAGTEECTPTLADDVHALLRDVEREACKAAESIALSGDYGEPDPYTELLAELEHARMTVIDAVQRVTFLRGHQHKWGDDDRCIHCGADGRA